MNDFHTTISLLILIFHTKIVQYWYHVFKKNLSELLFFVSPDMTVFNTPTRTCPYNRRYTVRENSKFTFSMGKNLVYTRVHAAIHYSNTQIHTYFISQVSLNVYYKLCKYLMYRSVDILLHIISKLKEKWKTTMKKK